MLASWDVVSAFAAADVSHEAWSAILDSAAVEDVPVHVDPIRDARFIRDAACAISAPIFCHDVAAAIMGDAPAPPYIQPEFISGGSKEYDMCA